MDELYGLKIVKAENGYFLIGIGEADFSHVILDNKNTKKMLIEEITDFFNLDKRYG